MVPLNQAAAEGRPGKMGLNEDHESEDWVVCSNSSSSSSSSKEEQVPCFVVLDDTWKGTSDLADLFAALQRPCFGLLPPQVSTAPMHCYIWTHTHTLSLVLSTSDNMLDWCQCYKSS